MNEYINPDQYHAGLCKLWNALGNPKTNGVDVYTRIADRIAELETQPTAATARADAAARDAGGRGEYGRGIYGALSGVGRGDCDCGSGDGGEDMNDRIKDIRENHLDCASIWTKEEMSQAENDRGELLELLDKATARAEAAEKKLSRVLALNSEDARYIPNGTMVITLSKLREALEQTP